MPWIDLEKCTGCKICVDKCPVDTILIENSKANINMDNCIRCGTCHSVCSQEAVRHDGEKIPEDIKTNIELTKQCMEDCAKYLGDVSEKAKCLGRMKKYFNKEKIVAEKTLEELEKLN